MKKIAALLLVLSISTMLTGCIGNPYKAGIKSLEDGEYDKAIENFEEAIADEKNLADSYRGLGIAFWETEEYQKSYDAMENALENGSKENATIHSIMGNCAMQIKAYEKAAEHYEATLMMEDISAELEQETQYNLVAAYECAGNIEKAREVLDNYIANYPDDAEALKEAEFLETR